MKKLITLLACAISVLSLVGCGQKQIIETSIIGSESTNLSSTYSCDESEAKNITVKIYDNGQVEKIYNIETKDETSAFNMNDNWLYVDRTDFMGHEATVAYCSFPHITLEFDSYTQVDISNKSQYDLYYYQCYTVTDGTNYYHLNSDTTRFFEKDYYYPSDIRSSLFTPDLKYFDYKLDTSSSVGYLITYNTNFKITKTADNFCIEYDAISISYYSYEVKNYCFVDDATFVENEMYCVYTDYLKYYMIDTKTKSFTALANTEQTIERKAVCPTTVTKTHHSVKYDITNYSYSIVEESIEEA